MTLQEAIQINQSLLDGTYDHRDENMEDALKLGIQAILYVQRNRLGDVINPDALLPAETKD